MANDEIMRRDEPGPDEGIRIKATPDDQDTEAHRKPVAKDVGPDEGARRLSAKDDDEAPGPDETRFSDRNLKVGIVPVEW